MIDWKTEISRVVYWKQVAADHDKSNALPWHLPRIGASDDEISNAEQVTGFVFPEQYKNFLRYANGWKGFFLSTDLYGTEEILENRHNIALERTELRSYLSNQDLKPSDVMVVGSSDYDLDIFFLFSSTSTTLPGGVIWFANEEIDRYESFGDFFSAMVNYNANTAQEMVAASA
jgi:SMI1 / KNR4 family (SUKH-1)